MSKNLSRAYLNKKKAIKINDLMVDQMKFQEIANLVMKQNNFGQSQLMHSEIKDIERAGEFWKVMLEAAEGFMRR